MNDAARTALLGLVAAGMATAAKSAAEGVLQPAAERLLPRPSRSNAQAPILPTTPTGCLRELVDAAARRTTGASASTEQRTHGSQVLHWVMGLGSGLIYTALSRRVPAARLGLGAPAGLVLYALTHASTLPAAGLQPPLRELPRAAQVWEPGSHIVYGLVLETTLRLLGRDRT